MADIFTDNSAVRNESGVQNNENISDEIDVDPCVDAANAEVFQAVSNRYTTPLSNTAAYEGSMADMYLRKLATQLGSCYLMKALYEGQGGDLMESVEDKCKTVRERLTMVAGGTVKLYLDDGSELDIRDSGLKTPTGFPTNSSLYNTEDPTDIPYFSTQDVF